MSTTVIHPRHKTPRMKLTQGHLPQQNPDAQSLRTEIIMFILTLTRRTLLMALLLTLGSAWAEDAPDHFVKRLTTDLLDTVKADPALRSGDMQRLSQLVDQKIMPHLNFRRMTALAVGPAWRQATPEQRTRL